MAEFSRGINDAVRANVAHMRASRSGRRILTIFLVLVGLAIMGAAWYVLPFVNVVVCPAIEDISVAADVRIDTALTEPLLAVGNIPGRIVADDSEQAELIQRGFQIVEMGGLRFGYEPAHMQSLVQRKVLELTGQDVIQVPLALTYTVKNPVLSKDKRSLTAVVQAATRAYRPLPVTDWRQRLPGLSLNKAWSLISSDKRVAAVVINVYPTFLANISQNIPQNPSSLTFTLDVEGKTSILE